jgi:hypothetical protein
MDSKQATKTTTVELINRKRLWFLIPVLLAPFFGLLLYSVYNWWMSISFILVGIFQLAAALTYFGDVAWNDKTYISETISINELDTYTEKEISLTRKLQVLAIITGILDLYPFFCQFHWIPQVPGYEGGIIVSILSIAFFLVFMGCAYEMRNPRIKEYQHHYKRTGKTKEETLQEEKIRLKKIEEEKNEKKKSKFGEEFIELGHDVVINDKTNKIFINSHEYNFDDILDFSVQDNSVTIHTGSTSTAKTNTRSMIGRAAVGGVLFGGTGAVIGGATAKRDIYNSGSSSSVNHDYSVIITVNNITHPNETVKLGDDEEILNKITSTLTVILHNKPINN